MVRYRCVGWGTTNSSGVATLDYDADGNPLLTSGYTGQGVGEVDFVASAESPSEINSSSDVSTPYEVLDAIFYDKGILNDSDTRDWSGYNNCSKERKTEYTTLDNTDDTNLGYAYLSCSTTDNICFEFDLKVNNLSNYVIVSLRQNTTNVSGYYTNWLGLSDNTWHHIKLTVANGKLVANVDGTNKTPQSIDSAWNRLFLIVKADNTLTVDYKNFKYYPI